MESQARYVFVGAFVLVFAVGFVVALLWLSGAGGRTDVTHYTVYFRQQSLDGLQKDSDVTMMGIKVGTVSEYRISSRSVEEVVVILALDKATPVKADTDAVIRRNLLTGLAWVDLVNSKQSSPLRTKVPTGELYPVIPEGRTELAELADSIPGLLEQVSSMSHRASALLSESNVKSFSQIMSNLEQVTTELSTNSQKLGEVLDDVSQAAEGVNKLSASFSGFVGNADKEVATVGKETVSALKSISETSTDLQKQIQAMSLSITNASQVFSQEITAVSQSIGEAADSVSTTFQEFENPKSILLGPSKDSLGPGEQLKR